MPDRKMLFWIVFSVLAAAALVFAGSSALAASQHLAGGLISGTVTSPLGYPLPEGTVVKLFEAGQDTVRGQAQPDLANGAFNLGPLPNGLYVIKAVPPEASGLTQSEPAPVSIANAPVEVGALALTEPQISGQVLAPDGVTLVQSEVTVRTGDGRLFQVITAAAGEFLVGGLPEGSYWLQATPLVSEPYYKSELLSVAISAGAPITRDLTLRPAQVWGTLRDDQGHPALNGLVVLASADGTRRSDLSNAAGYWAIGDLPDGAYQLSALPPLGQHQLSPPAPVMVTLPGATNPYELQFRSAPKMVSGVVATNTGAPVENALIVARRVDRAGHAGTLSAADGSYELRLGAGLWALTVQPVSSTLPADWLAADPPQYVFFRENLQPEAQVVDFEVLVADATVTGQIELPGGGAPTFTVTVGLFSNEGLGRRVAVDPDTGAFEVHLPSGGYKVLVHSHDPYYLGPVLEPVSLGANQTLDLGSLTLLPRDALVNGTLSANGIGVEGIPVVAWRRGAPGSLETRSGPDGAYALSLSAGEWHIQPAPRPDQPYLYLGAGQDVTLSVGAVLTDVNFELASADAAINGILVDESGAPVSDAEGWAAATQLGNPQVHNGAPILAGSFSILVPEGEYQVAAHLPAGSPYLSTGEREVVVAAGESETITLTVTLKDAAIAGGLVDPRQPGQPVAGVPGVVGAWNAGNWAVDRIDPGNGTFRLGVAGGLWHLNYRISSREYVKLGGGINLPVESGQTVIIGLPVTSKDGALSGVVLDPAGDPLAGARVSVHGVSGVVHGLDLHTFSRADGSFQLALPHGVYHLTAAYAGQDWIQPAERRIEILPDGALTGIEVQFQEPDATLSGTLTVSDTLAEGRVYVWAWSETGGFVQDVFTVTQSGGQASGSYSLGVLQGTTWHLGGVFETSAAYWSGSASLEVSGSAATLDLTLTGPNPKPAPVVVTFDASQPQSLALADGTLIYIPGGAMPVEGEVTLRVVPIATLPHQKAARLLRYGYAFLATGPDGEPVEAQFNQDVVIRFHYDERDLRGYPERLIRPVYFSTTANEWTTPEAYVVDMQANTVTMQINHFTDYALVSDGTTSLFLPTVGR